MFWLTAAWRRIRRGGSSPLLGQSRRYCHVRALVRYPRYRTLPRPTETRLPVAFLDPICKQRAQPPLLLRLASLDLRHMTHVRTPKMPHIDCNEPARNLLPLACPLQAKGTAFRTGRRTDSRGFARRFRQAHCRRKLRSGKLVKFSGMRPE
jgi:hypothetical protein